MPQEKAGNTVPSPDGDAVLPEPAATAAATHIESGALQAEETSKPPAEPAPRDEEALSEANLSSAPTGEDEATAHAVAETRSPGPESVEQHDDKPESHDDGTAGQPSDTPAPQEGIATDTAATVTVADSKPQPSSVAEEQKDVLVERIASAASAHAARTPSEIADHDISHAVVEDVSFEPTGSGAEPVFEPERTAEGVPAEDLVAQDIVLADDQKTREPPAVAEDTATPGQHEVGDIATTQHADAVVDATPQYTPASRDLLPPGPRHRGEDLICMPTGRDLAVSYAWIALRYAAYVLAGYLALIVVLVFVYRFVNPPASTLMVWRWVGGAPMNQTWVPIERISPNLIRSVVAAEDARFCQHWGIDLGAMKEAIENARDGIPRGASTISMQVVKNVFLWPSRSFFRKVIEIPVTVLMELIWPKRRILEVYLNVAEWAPGVYGAEAAARHHFKKPASRLSAHQAALMAAALPNPFRRDAGDPGPRTYRKARVVQARARASKYAASCALPVAQRRSKR